METDRLNAGTPGVNGDAAASKETAPMSKCDIAKRAAVVIVLLAVVIYVTIDSFTTKHVLDALESFLSWVRVAGVRCQHVGRAHASPSPLATARVYVCTPCQVKDAGAIGPVVFAAVYFAGTILFFPGSVLTIGSGFAFSQAFGQGWGIVAGSLVVMVGATSGAAAAFLLGRYALRSLVADKAAKYRILAAIDRALQGQVRAPVCSGGVRACKPGAVLCGSVPCVGLTCHGALTAGLQDGCVATSVACHPFQRLQLLHGPHRRRIRAVRSGQHWHDPRHRVFRLPGVLAE